MNLKEILELIDKVADRGIAGVEIEQAGTKVRIEGHSSQTQVIHSYMSEMGAMSGGERGMLPGGQTHHAALPAAPQHHERQTEEESEAGLHIITSPIVGTFYRSPNPETESFVNAGDKLTKGKILCIIEAMKLMNEIESDVEGVLVRIYPQNGQPVEYGEKLFAVRV